MFKYINFKEQLSKYLNSNKIDELELIEIKNQILYICDIFEFIEIKDLLDQYNILGSFVNNDYEIISFKNIKNIKEAELSLNTVDFLAYLISLRFRTSQIDKIHVGYLNDYLDLKIIQTKVLLDDLKNNIFCINDAFGVFFIYEKKKALAVFLNFFVKLLKERPDHEIFPYLISKFHHFFSLLGLEYIPFISRENYRNLTSEDNSNNYIYKNEIQIAIREKEYFAKDYPLINIDFKKLLSKNNYSDEGFLRYTISKYFELVLMGKSKFINGIDIADVFLSNLSDPIPIYEISELLNTKIILEKYIREENGKDSFLAFFCCLYESSILIGISHKLPYLLEKYFGIELISSSTAEQYFKSSEKRSKNFKKYLNKSSEFILKLGSTYCK